MTTLIYVIAAILVCIAIFLAFMINTTLITKYTFRKRKIKYRKMKRPRGASFASPLLHDAIFAHHDDTPDVEEKADNVR